MHNNNTINKYSKPTKPNSDKLSNMPKINLIKPFELAENFNPITDKNMNLRVQCCKAILTHSNQTWEKKVQTNNLTLVWDLLTEQKSAT